MQVSVEATGGLGKRMTVEVPAEKVESEVKKRLKSMQPTVKLQGFRPGKVPMSVVKKRFEGKVRQEVTGEVVNFTFQEAVKKEDLKLAGMPKIEAQSLNHEAGLKYVAVFEVYPEFQLSSAADIKIERETADIDDVDIDAMIEKLRKQRSKWTSVQRAVNADDRVTINYNGTIDGESFAGGDGEDLEVVIGSNVMIAGFEDGLMAREVDQTVEMDLRFPDDYKSKDVAGKEVHFNVVIKSIEEPELPVIDDEFIKAFGIEEGGLSAFREELKRNMQLELEKIIKSKAKKSVMDALLAANDFEIPESMIDAESQRLAQQMGEQVKMDQGGKTPGGFTPFEGSQFKEQGRRRVALGLIMAEIIEKNELKASTAKVRTEIEAIAVSYHDPKEVVSWYYQDKARLQEIESMVLEGQVVDWVLKSAQVTDIKTTFERLAKRLS